MGRERQKRRLVTKTSLARKLLSQSLSLFPPQPGTHSPAAAHMYIDFRDQYFEIYQEGESGRALCFNRIAFPFFSWEFPSVRLTQLACQKIIKSEPGSDNFVGLSFSPEICAWAGNAYFISPESSSERRLVALLLFSGVRARPRTDHLSKDLEEARVHQGGFSFYQCTYSQKIWAGANRLLLVSRLHLHRR